jgi:hypothetical protein
MDLIDEVDYHCCIFCDKLYPSEYELLMHVSENHQDIVDLNSKPKNRDETLDYIQSSFVDDEDNIHCDDYLNSINNTSPTQKVYKLYDTINLKSYTSIYCCFYYMKLELIIMYFTST